MSYPTTAQLHDTLSGMQAEGGGMLHVAVINLDEAPGLIAAAARGDRRAFALAQAVIQALAGIRRNRRNRKAPPLCACCPRPLIGKTAFHFAVALPAVDVPAHAVAFAICTRCAPSTEALERKAQDAVREFWPDSRPVQVTHHHGGRA